MLTRLILTCSLASAWWGCALVEAAAELPFGAEAGIPGVSQTVTMDIDRVNAVLRQVSGLDEQSFQTLALPSEATFADLRDLLCEMVVNGFIDEPRLELEELNETGTPEPPRDSTDEEPTDPPEGSNVRGSRLLLALETPDGGSCNEGTVKVELSVDFVPFTAEQAASLKEKLNQDITQLADAIVQVRFLIRNIFFQRDVGTGPAPAPEMLSSFYIAIADPSIPDDPDTPFEDGWLELVPFFLLSTISEETPQRFELDPDSPVTQGIKDVILDPPPAGDPAVLQVEAGLTIDSAQLEATPLRNSGIVLDVQPEIVINGLKVVEKQL